MKKTIRELFYGSIYHCEKCGIKNLEIKALTGKLSEYRESLCSELTDKQKETLEKYDDLLGEISSLFNEEFFVEGFLLGAKIIKEALEQNKKIRLEYQAENFIYQAFLAIPRRILQPR